jgi:hypothetical protein
MAQTTTPGRHIEIFFNDADRVVDLELQDEDPGLASVMVDVIETDDPDAAEQVLRDNLGNGTVRRRRH